MKKNIVLMLALASALSLAGCGTSENSDNSTQTTTGETTTATTAEVTTTAAQTETTQPETQSAEAATTTAVTKDSASAAAGTVTTAAPAGTIDLDAMISSAEALIPKITAFTGMDLNLNITKQTGANTSAAANQPEVTALTSAATVATTANQTEKPAATNAAPVGTVNSLFSLIFDGASYALPISGTLALPNGWKVDESSLGRSVTRFINDSYESSEIDEVKRGGNTLNGVMIGVIHAMKNGKTYPALQMYKGITWGSTVDEIKAQYGEPMRSSTYTQYGCNMTSLYYSNDDGSYLILHAAENYGLVLVEMYKS